MVSTSDGRVSFSGGALAPFARNCVAPARVPAFSNDSAVFLFSGFNGYGEILAHRLADLVILPY